MSMKELDNINNILGVDNADNAYDSSNVVANADGSIIERLQYIQANGGAAISDALYGANGIASFPAGAQAANNVSIAEVLRYVQENVIRGGTVLPATQSLYDILAGANGIATMPAAAAPANGVSIAEMIRDIWDALRNGTGGSEPATNLSIVDEVKKLTNIYNNANYLSVTADLTNATWNTVATHEVFTVTGLVRMFMVAEIAGSGAGATATMEFGNEGDTDLWIPTTTITDMAQGEIWADATPTEVDGAYTSLMFDRVVNGVDLGYEIKTAAATGGSIIFHGWWVPLNSTGAVAAGDGSALV